MRHDAVFILGKELRRDRERALRELGARSAAAAIAHRQGVPRVLTLEAPLQGQEEAGSRIVARILADLGVPRHAIHLEETTRSTREEALSLRRLLDQHGWSRALVVTSAYHVPRSRHYFEDVLGRGRVVVQAPEAFLEQADPRERELILAGTPDPAALAEEGRVEARFMALARVLTPLPRPVRWELEVLAGGLYRGIDGLRGSGSAGVGGKGADKGKTASG